MIAIVCVVYCTLFDHVPSACRVLPPRIFIHSLPYDAFPPMVRFLLWSHPNSPGEDTADHPSLDGRRHECAPPRKARRSIEHASYVGPRKLGPRLDHIPVRKNLLLYMGIKPFFRTFICVIFILNPPLSFPPLSLLP